MKRITTLSQRTLFFIILGITGMLTSPAAFSQATGDVDVKIQLTDACIINGDPTSGAFGFGDLDFGTTGTLFTQQDGQVLSSGSTIEMTCLAATPPTLEVLSGLHDAQGGTSNHAMAKGTEYIPYDIYDAPSRTAGDVIVNNNVFFTSANDGTPENVDIYGRAFGDPLGGGFTPGTYTDKLTIQVNF